MAARISSQCFCEVEKHGTAKLGTPRHSTNRLPEHNILLGTEAAEKTQLARRNRPRNKEHLRQARHSARRAETPFGRGRRCRNGQRFGENNFPGTPCRRRNYLLFFQRSSEKPSRPRAQVHGQGGAIGRQLFCSTQLGCIQRRFVLLHSKGSALPD